MTPIPGTTRDALDTPFVWNNKPFVIIDTAGIRRMAKIDSPVERYSVFRSLRAADRCNVAFIVLDASDMPVSQDARIAGYVEEAGRGMVLVANKCDLIEGESKEELVLNNGSEGICPLYHMCLWFSCLP